MSDLPADPATVSAPKAAALDYAPPAAARRKWMRRIVRWGLVLAVIGLAVGYGPRAWRRWEFLRLQARCMEAVLPGDRPIIEEDPVRAKELVAKWPGEYRLDVVDSALRYEPRWAAFASRAEFNGPRRLIRLDHVCFMHERFTPSGKRRLVVVDHWGLGIIIEPGGPFTDARLLSDPDTGERSFVPLGTALGDADCQYFAGVPDPVDRSRFSIPIVVSGVRGYLDGRLEDDDRVTITVRDKSAFLARVRAAAPPSASAEPPAVPAAAASSP